MYFLNLLNRFLKNAAAKINGHCRKPRLVWSVFINFFIFQINTILFYGTHDVLYYDTSYKKRTFLYRKN